MIVIEHDRQVAHTEIAQALKRVTDKLHENGFSLLQTDVRDCLLITIAETYWAGFSAGQKSVPE